MSSFAVILPLPDAVVVTGGTSSAPVSFTLLAAAIFFVDSHADSIVVHPASANTADATIAEIAERNTIENFM
jgi:hypothetical protein